MTHSAQRIFRALLISLLISAAPAFAQSVQKPVQTNQVNNALWIRAYAFPWQEITATWPIDHHQSRENALRTDPRFRPLLKSSFPQHQWFWKDRDRFVPMEDLVKTFIGVPGMTVLDENRYVTVDGCIPNDRGDKGMLWIDTTTHPTSIIFAATGFININEDDRGGMAARDHLWLFTSTHLNWQKIPSAFVSSLRRWNQTNTMGLEPIPFILVTIVQPNGEMVDLAPSLLFLSASTNGAK
jgi:hypothetical protein